MNKKVFNASIYQIHYPLPCLDNCFINSIGEENKNKIKLKSAYILSC